MIIYADNDLKEDVKHIWKTCFPDDTYDFTEFYFEKKYKNENTLVWMENGKAVACLQMLPYSFSFYGSLLPVAYISGAATLPEFQNQGIMKKLVAYAFYEMQKKQIPLTVLIPQEPWLIAFYERLGYSITFLFSESILQSNQGYSSLNGYSINPINISSAEKAFTYYSDYFSKQNLCIQKSKEDFDALITFYELENGHIIAAELQGEILALCFATPVNNTLIIKDLIADNKKAKEALLHHLTTQYPTYEIKIVGIYEKGTHPFTKGMARIIDPEKLLTIYTKAHTEIRTTFSLVDNNIKENSGFYRLINGKCIKKDMENTPLPPHHFDLNINLLTNLLLGYKHEALHSSFSSFVWGNPYMSLMLE